ncbi:hypothetical protein [Tropicimonas sp. IMCC6043]|uniref:hypothetical protein n=1 Tax=Tropicimonas sp. IMCC6043 TaxID=2510645 RepID=UPI00101D7D48|nr:hypothetical protein [Tropicimonas sp. IMCC6043]RYH07378.1 hypothetical protein EU800_20545 [Tropicimonas sp. IMCC6043]
MSSRNTFLRESARGFVRRLAQAKPLKRKTHYKRILTASIPRILPEEPDDELFAQREKHQRYKVMEIRK